MRAALLVIAGLALLGYAAVMAAVLIGALQPLLRTVQSRRRNHP